MWKSKKEEKYNRGKGGECRKSNVQYCMCCKLCPAEDPTIYIGETARNLYTRSKEHFKNYKSQNNDSFILKDRVENVVAIFVLKTC